MRYPWASTSISTRKISNHRHSREGGNSVSFIFSLLVLWVSPVGEILSLLVQRKYPKKARPDGPGRYATTLRCSPERAAAELAHSALRPSSLKHPRRAAPVPSALLGGPNGDPRNTSEFLQSLSRLLLPRNSCPATPRVVALLTHAPKSDPTPSPQSSWSGRWCCPK